jgi:hypothetical protein
VRRSGVGTARRSIGGQKLRQTSVAERVLIFGSRNYPRMDLVDAFVDILPSDTIVVSGCAPGVDTRAERRAKKRGLKFEGYPAEWGKYGRQAGFLRNSVMVGVADRGAGFWDGTSIGTADTIRKMAIARKPCAVIHPDHGTEWLQYWTPSKEDQR